MEWISVKDRLPEMHKSDFGEWLVSDYVLTCDKLGDVFITFCETEEDGTVFWNDTDSSITITHWAHLPKPPKE